MSAPPNDTLNPAQTMPDKVIPVVTPAEPPAHPPAPTLEQIRAACVQGVQRVHAVAGPSAKRLFTEGWQTAAVTLGQGRRLRLAVGLAGVAVVLAGCLLPLAFLGAAGAVGVGRWFIGGSSPGVVKALAPEEEGSAGPAAPDADLLRAEVHYARGVREQAGANPAGAIAAYTEAIRIYPRHRWAYHCRALAHHQQGNFEQAIADATKAIELHPRLAEAYYFRSQARWKRGDQDGAIADWTEAAALDPEVGYWYEDDGGNVFGAMFAHGAAVQKNPRDALAHFGMANRYRSGLFGQDKTLMPEAVKGYDKAIQIRPRFALAYANRANARLDLLGPPKPDQTGGPALDAVIADFDLALRHHPRLCGAFNDRGIAWQRKGDLKRARADYDEAIRLNPEFGRPYFNRALVRARAGDVDGAIADWTAHTRVTLKAAQPWNPGDASLDEAIKQHSDAIRKDPKDALALFLRGNAHRAAGQQADAIADYTAALRARPGFTLAYLNRAGAYEVKGDWDRARADYAEAIRVDPKMPLAYHGRGGASYKQGKHAEAIADFTTALRLQPRYSAAYHSRGLARLDKGDPEGAVADFTSALYHQPELVAAYKGRGLAYKARGERDKAIVDFEVALRTADDDAALQNEARQQLTRLGVRPPAADRGPAPAAGPQTCFSCGGSGTVYGDAAASSVDRAGHARGYSRCSACGGRGRR